MATIGITIPESVWSARSERFYTQVLHGLEDTAVSRGHTVLSHVAASRTEELEVMRRWAERGIVDLVILKDLLDEDDLPDQVRRLGLPFVVIGDVHQGEFSSVTVDNAGTMQPSSSRTCTDAATGRSATSAGRRTCCTAGCAGRRIRRSCGRRACRCSAPRVTTAPTAAPPPRRPCWRGRSAPPSSSSTTMRWRSPGPGR